VRTYAYGSRSQQVLDATINTGRRAAPWVIAIHGGYWAGGSRKNIPAAVEAFYGAGFQVFSIDYPLLPAVRWSDQRASVLSATAWVKAHAAMLRIDPARGVVYGESAGGNLASTIGTDGAGITRTNGVVSIAGASDPHLAWRSPVPSHRKLADWATVGAGCPPRQGSSWCRARWREMTPALSASADDAPELLVHAVEDLLVPYQSSVVLNRHLRAKRVQSTLVTVPGTEHNGTRLVWRDPELRAQVLSWVRQRTRNDSPSVVKARVASRPPGTGVR
jgi:acetyl esterase/lipase